MKQCVDCGQLLLTSDFPPKSNRCRPCKKAYMAAWRAANAEHVRAYQRAHNRIYTPKTYRVVTEKLCAKCKTIKPASEFNKHSETTDRLDSWCRACNRISQKQWEAQNPNIRNQATQVSNALRRARYYGASGRFTRPEWKSLCEKYDNRCLCCGKSEPEISLTVDHVIPLSQGGANTIENIQPLCWQCNRQKGAQSTDFRRSMT